ncbi:MAG: hypothetical protein RI897_4145 [Verrucomicrobiota bacterium]|jgi:uncharacterized protein involved in response to NO
MPTTPSRASLADLGAEPFRIFFPLAVASGIAGASLWPLHYAGWLELYPGQNHARLMTYGLLAGFILGFLGTALPRMLSAPPIGIRNTLLLTTLYLATQACLVSGHIGWADHAFLTLMLSFTTLLAIRSSQRQDTPPPGFTLAALALACIITSASIGVAQYYNPELPSPWIQLQRLLGYQGFLLLPILGVGPYLLPRFFNLPSTHDFPETLTPNTLWWKRTALALTAGTLILASFIIEIQGHNRLAHALRFTITLSYLLLEFPFLRSRHPNKPLTRWLQISFTLLITGFLAIALLPTLRVALLHFTLIGGFSSIAFVVATRVVLGHSGQLHILQHRHRWLTTTLTLMLIAMATRISGDFWPKIMTSHYIYGALAWIIAAILWSAFVLPHVRHADPD